MTCSLAAFLVKEKQPAATSVIFGLYVGPVDSVRAALFQVIGIKRVLRELTFNLSRCIDLSRLIVLLILLILFWLLCKWLNIWVILIIGVFTLLHFLWLGFWMRRFMYDFELILRPFLPNL